MIPADFLLESYGKGIFPMALESEIAWFSPDPRAIIPLDAFHVPHGLARVLRKNPFEIRINHSFENVMRACAERDDTWISEEIIESYCNLHRLGFAHSIESWKDDQLVGGLYGVALGGAFFGESMFHSVTDASKVALNALIAKLRGDGFTLLDIQWVTPHLETFGAVEIPRRKYLQLLKASIRIRPENPF